jgi:polysaccharide pyruvyl transferase WcaK-like protein
MKLKRASEQIISNKGNEKPFRVGIISPYTGGNLGDAAIIESTQQHILKEFPNAQFLLVVLYSEQVKELHGLDSFPLTAVERPFYYNPNYCQSTKCHNTLINKSKLIGLEFYQSWVKLKRKVNCIPYIKLIYQYISIFLGSIKREITHSFKVWKVVNDLHMVVVAGGGQFDDEYGGPWGHPYSLFKWVNMASLAKVPVFFIGIGVCEIRYRQTRYFLRNVIKKAQRVSLRDLGSIKLLRDLGVKRKLTLCPDLVFGLFEDKEHSQGEEDLSRKGSVVGISPMIFGRVGSWPTENMTVYNRYRRNLIEVGLKLLNKNYSLTLFVTDYADFNLAEELYNEFDRISGKKDKLLLIPLIRPSKMISVLKKCNVIIASRLHGILLSYISEIPVVGISYHRKVSAHMEDMGQLNYCFDIGSFKPENIENKIEEILNQQDKAISELTKLVSTRFRDVKREFNIIKNGIKGTLSQGEQMDIKK